VLTRRRSGLALIFASALCWTIGLIGGQLTGAIPANIALCGGSLR